MIAELSAGEHEISTVTADPAECRAIGERLGILLVEGLTAELQLLRDLTGDVNMVGRIVADVVQACVVTLDPVAQHVDTHTSRHCIRYTATHQCYRCRYLAHTD